MTAIAQHPAEQLARLPEPVQAELWSLTRHLMGMSREERENALKAMVGIVGAFIRAGGAMADLPIIRLLDVVGQTIRELDVAGFPRTDEGVK